MPFISEVPPIYVQRWYTGWITLRNQLVTPIRVMGRRVVQLFDALIGGNDFEITSKLTLKRRAGHTSYVTINGQALAMYSWKSNTQGTIPIIDTTSDVEYINSTPANVQITTKSTNAQSSILGIGNYLYVGNPQFSFKWDGPAGAQGKTNWGISIGPFGNSTGPNTAGAGANVNNGGVVWVNPNNVTSAVSFATASFSGTGANTQLLQSTTFGFAISAGTTITGIQFTFDQNATSLPSVTEFLIEIIKNGVAILSSAKIVFPTIATSTLTVGGVSDLWGTTWLPNDINQSNFGLQIQGKTNAGATMTFSVRHVQCTVFGVGGPTVTLTGAGSFAAVNGWSYVVAYGNSSSGEISNASPISANTGPFSGKASVGIGLVASTDPQVNQIRVYRTTDSGGGNQFFELPTSPYQNTTTTVQDTAADTALQVTSQAEINLGNTPPPQGLINLEWFAGRMWGSVNNVLFASTGPQTLSGKAPSSNWQPAFQWELPQPILRNVRGPNGMVVFTVDDSYIVRGTDIVNYTVNEWVKDFGIRTQNAVDTDGTNMYVFTSDRQFIQVTASGAADIGMSIADQLLNVDPTSVYVKVNRLGLDSIVRILDTVNNVFYDYNLNQQCWNLPGILQMPACTAMGSIETVPGTWRLILSSFNSGSGINTLAFRDTGNAQDLGTAYAPNAVVGSLEFSDPGALAKFGGRAGILVESAAVGSFFSVSVLPNDQGVTTSAPVGAQITGSFTSLSGALTYPPTLGAQPSNFRAQLFYWMTGTNLSGFVRHIQVKLSLPAENSAGELLGMAIVPDEKSESEASGALPPIQGR